MLILPAMFNLDFIQPFSFILHQWCLEHIQNHTENVEIYSALLCGKKLDFTGETRKIFAVSGLIHLMVVSGAHLIFLEKIWEFLPKWPYKNFFIATSLIIYALMTGLHPPVFRALSSFFIFRFSSYFKLFWSPCLRIMLSGVLSLICNPQWVFSTSLQMSWIGALAFSYSRYSKLMGNIMCYMLILPIISQWTTLHPISVLLNWILFPIISVTLFPLSVASFICPVFYHISEPLWSFLLQTLMWLRPFLEKVPFYIPTISPDLRWIYISFIFLISQFLWIIFRRMR